MNRLVITGLALIVLCGHADKRLLAAPIIKITEGKFMDQAVVKIKGVNFGSKETAAPLLWADFRSSLQPSHLGIKRDWDIIQNMTWSTEGRGGTGTAKAANGSGKWTMAIDYQFWTKESQKVYVFKHQRMNFLITDNSQNWKIWRMWPPYSNAPNLYLAPSNGRVYVEHIGQESGFWGDFRNPSTDWYSEEIIFRASSGYGRKDGLVVLKWNGKEVAKGSLITRSQEAPAYMMRNYVIHGVLANAEQWRPPWKESNRMWINDVYVDTTWARVMIGDEMSYIASRQWEIQIPTYWSDDEIHIQANPGAFPKGRVVYLYVFDEEGRVNMHGYPMLIEKAVKQGAALR